MPEVDGLVANTQKLDARAWNVAPALPAPQDRTRAFIAVQNGCDHACTFCVIPQGRGPSRSLTISEVLREVERYIDHGAPEVVLSRARRDRGGPGVASRFLLRLQAMAGSNLRSDERALALAAAIDAPETVIPAERPEPRPSADQTCSERRSV